MVEHILLELVIKTSIGIRTILDHAPVIMMLRFPETHEKMSAWGLKEDLIWDKEVEGKIEEINQYFHLNNTPDASGHEMGSTQGIYQRNPNIYRCQKKKGKVQQPPKISERKI